MPIVAALLASTACVGKTSPVAPSEGPWRFTGNVSNTASLPIVGARLTVQDGVNRGTQVTSDSAGNYAFDRLASGRFTVVISASGFTSVSPLVDLYRDLDVNFALKTAP